MDTSQVTNMCAMFYGASAFYQPITMDTSQVMRKEMVRNDKFGNFAKISVFPILHAVATAKNSVSEWWKF